MMQSNLGELLHDCAKRYHDRPFVTIAESGRQISYAEFEALTNRLAQGLLENFSRESDYVALMLENSIEYLAATYALKKVDLIEVSVNRAFRGPALARMIDLTGACILFTSDAHVDALQEVRDQLPSLRTLIMVGDSERARAVFAELQAGRRPMLDTRDAIGAEITDLFPSVAQYCRRNGIDPVKEPIPVAPAAHYHMGGIATDAEGRASLTNMWVCGEASSTGLHGSNRLASNGLLEALVFARICATSIATTVSCENAAEITAEFKGSGRDADVSLVAELRATMSKNVGVIRNAQGLETALRDIARIDAQAQSENLRNMCATATLIAAAALARKESRGAHERSDFPDLATGPGERSMMTLTQAQHIRAQALDAKEMT